MGGASCLLAAPLLVTCAIGHQDRDLQATKLVELKRNMALGGVGGSATAGSSRFSIVPFSCGPQSLGQQTLDDEQPTTRTAKGTQRQWTPADTRQLGGG